MLHALYGRAVGTCVAEGVRTSSSNSRDLLERLDARVLDGHNGCVNTVSFTPEGDTLISGSDDQAIILWDWEKGSSRLIYDSGHRDNVFQARAIPHTNNSTIVSCAADGQVRVGYLRPGSGSVDTQRVAKHQMRAHKLALRSDPGCFFSCGEDGLVISCDLRCRDSISSRPLLKCSSSDRSGMRRTVGLNSIHCNPARPWQFVLGASDEVVRIYDTRMMPPGSVGDGVRAGQSVCQPVRQLVPRSLRRSARNSHYSCTCAVFSRQGEVLASFNDGDVFLFGDSEVAPEASAPDGKDEQREGEHDDVVQVFSGHRNYRTVKGVSFAGASDEYIVSGSDDGHVYIWTRDGVLRQWLKGDRKVVNCIEPHPQMPHVMATSGIDHDVKLLIVSDLRLWRMGRNRPRGGSDDSSDSSQNGYLSAESEDAGRLDSLGQDQG
ncbi:hypothetical protein WJX73_008283 [Symbiochloris irregularis]|uniref:Uncharacterized protein n=1 Tax=Symbiochloris irregularis TaxID=706552 RepID=A0AAW1PHR3_9CHLO